MTGPSTTTGTAPAAPTQDRRRIQHLQRLAGNAAVSRLVAQRYTAPVKPPPAQSARFRAVKADVAAKRTKLAAHAPPAAESKASQDAAVAPPDDKEAQGKAANAEKMNAAKPGEFDKKAFVDAVNKAIDAQAPKNLDEADKFAKSGKADQVKAEVDGKVTDGKESSAKDIETATKAPPDTSAAQEKAVTPLTPDRPPANPGAPSATDAVPEKQPAAVTDFSEGPAANDKAMADAEVTEEQLARSNEPEFTEALSAKKTAETDAAKAPAKGQAAENAQLSAAKANAAASGAQAMTALTATRSAAGKQVDGGKNDTKSKDEKKRAEVTAKLQKVYDATKKDVEETLSGLDKKVDTAFASGEKAARDAFTADHKSRMKKYKDKRYSGLRGKARWVKDKFAGLPKEANDLYQESRKLYVSRMQTVISSVADLIGAELGRAKARIAKGRTELKAEVDKLPADLRQFGEEAAKDFAGKFDDLEATVNEKSEQLVQDLAQKYTAALNKIDEEIKKLQEANKGLIDKAKDAIAGVIKTINELKNLLLGILAKAASAIMKIIKDPIGFLGNLVTAVGAGLNLFITNIADHLKTGLVSWLLGTAVKAGLDLPARFDLKGIIHLIGGLLGLTWDNIRTRITRKGVPDEAMSKVETSVPVAASLAREGPAGAAKEIQAETGDLKSTILGKLTTYLIPTVLIAGITWIISLLNPASAFVRAVKGIIDIVTFIVTQGAQIADFVNAVLDAVIAIANGAQAGVPKLIEAALATSVPLLIGFLAALLGIGGLANKVKSVFQSVSRPVTRAIDKLVDFIAKKGKALWAKLKKGDRSNNSQEDKHRRLDKGMKSAVAALSKYRNRPVSSETLRPILSEIRIRYGLKELSPVANGDNWSVQGKVNPVSLRKTPAPIPSGDQTSPREDKGRKLVQKNLPNYGDQFIMTRAHNWWYRRQLNKTKLWDGDVLKSTRGAARAYLRSPQTVDAVYQEFFKGQRNHPDKPNAYETIVFKGTSYRQELIKHLGNQETVEHLRAKGLEKVAAGSTAKAALEEMNFTATSEPYGVFKPFPEGVKDPDPDLVEAVNGARRDGHSPIMAFLYNMVEFGKVDKITWRKFNEIWNSDGDSSAWIKGRFREISSGMHEWIPSNYIRPVLQTAIEEKNKGSLNNGLNWVTLQNNLRSRTGMVLWQIVGSDGQSVDPGGHVGSFYEAYKNRDGETRYKSVMTDGTHEFHNKLRAAFRDGKEAGAKAFVGRLKEMLGGSDGLIWNGDVDPLPDAVRRAEIGALYRVAAGTYRAELTVEELAEIQRENFLAVEADFDRAEKSLT
ncbi:phage tail protein [Streptomyces sp. P11-1]|uniref:phage tail protein n=1 Tax=Streptomyces sp. P11-1 TaxID=3423221 RepID=UPI003D2F03B7